MASPYNLCILYSNIKKIGRIDEALEKSKFLPRLLRCPGPCRTNDAHNCRTRISGKFTSNLAPPLCLASLMILIGLLQCNHHFCRV